MAKKRLHSSRGNQPVTGAPFGAGSGLPVLIPTPACWAEVGPAPFLGFNAAEVHAPPKGIYLADQFTSGQVSSIAVDWVNDSSGNTVYVGSSSGGLWKSTNGLSDTPSFRLVSDQKRSLSVGAVALDMNTNPPSIYVGTGAPDNSSNVASYTGTGILINAGRRQDLDASG